MPSSWCRPCRTAVIIGALSLASAVPRASAAQPQPQAMPAARITDSLPAARAIPWVTSREWQTAGRMAAVTALLLPLDRSAALQVDQRLAPTSPVVRLADDVSAVVEPTVLLSTVALVGIGRLSQRPAVTEVGMHGAEALVVASAMTGGAKRVFGRLRPRAVESRRPMTFEPFDGRDDARSLPSGHATLSFTMATVVMEELSQRPRFQRDRRARRVLGTVLYGTAAAIGAARVAERDHWLSDIAAGAGVGILSARWTVRQRHARGANRFERWILGAP